MPDETTKKDEATTTATAAVKAPKTVKVGDTVHLVHREGALGGKTRFGKAHAEAEVLKVHQKGKFVDLVVHDADPAKSLTITSAPRDDAGELDDSWHFPEAE